MLGTLFFSECWKLVVRLGNPVEVVAAPDGNGAKLRNRMQGKIPAMFSANSLAYWLGASTNHIASVSWLSMIMMIQ